jgi:hypothetical protein
MCGGCRPPFSSGVRGAAARRAAEVENGVVFFGVNSGAANDFYFEAKDAGFEVIKGASQSWCYENSDEFFKLPKKWFLRLMPV